MYNFWSNNRILFFKPPSTSAILASENFEGLSIGDDLTDGDWTWSQYIADTSTFKAAAGKVGECVATSGSWAGGYHLDKTGSDAWSNYSFEFDISSYVDRILVAFRVGATAAYWMQCRPGVANESKISIGGRDHVTGYTLIDTQTCPGPATSCKIVVNGTSIKVYFNGSATATHDFSDATLSTGTVGVSAFTDGWEIDNIVVTEI